ncbi:exosome nuclease [Mayamaea pseudoterrestris]|nr:exosome nuclease [Mayamaea pseudoterrestris]
MGRRYRGKSKKHSSAACDEPSASWSHHHKEALLRYLKDYRDGAVACYYGKNILNDCDDEDVCIIGGVILPALTREVLEQPFLGLPNISSKQRRMVHECCLEADLFHASVGSSRHSRMMAVSLYADGLKGFFQVDESTRSAMATSTDSDSTRQQHHHAKMYTYSPWFCRNHEPGDTKLLAVERDAKQHISHLQAHPEECLRDNVDAIEFDPTKLDDLSQITLPAMPSHIDDDTLVLVDTAEKMKDCIQQLEQAEPTEIAFDLECHNPSKHAQVCCLLQITCNNLDIDFVIDTLAPGVWEHVSGLAPLFENPNIVKVGHSIGSLDVTSLHRNFGCFVINAFDTYEAAKILKLPGKGLGDVCQLYGLRNADRYKRLKEMYQACDWRIRPLTAEMIHYARYDVHFLLPLRRIMMRDLIIVDKARMPIEEPMESMALKLATAADDDDEGEARELDSDEETPKKKNRSIFSRIKSKVVANSPTKRNEGNQSVGSGESEAASSKVGNEEVHDASNGHDKDLDGASLDGEPINSNHETGELFFFTPEKSAPPNVALPSTHHEMFWTPENIPGKAEKPFVANAESLRKHPQLLETIAASQKACKAFFSLGKEPHSKNTLFVSLLQRSAKKQVNWTNENTKLYVRLATWRTEAAAKLQCLPGFIASLEFLTGVAWKCPQSIDGLKLIASDLPDALADNESLCYDLLAVVRDCGPSSAATDIYYFENKKCRTRNLLLAKRVAFALSISASLGCVLLYTKLHRKLGR